MSARPSAPNSAPTSRHRDSYRTAGSAATWQPAGADAGADAGLEPAVGIPARFHGADALKAVSIIGVVFIHADGVFDVQSRFHDVVGDVFRFCVPVFIALYAHFACVGMQRRETPIRYLQNRFGRLLLQFVAWSIVYTLLYAHRETLTPRKFVTTHWGGNGWPGQYYFLIVLQLTLLMPWLGSVGRWFRGHRPALLCGGLAFYAAIVYPHWQLSVIVGQLSDRPVVYWLPYALLGVAWPDRTRTSTASGSSGRGKCALNSVFAGAAVVASLALIPLEDLIVAPYNVVHSVYLMPSVFVATAALITLVTGTSAADPQGTRPGWFWRTAALLSANTLGIFVLNPMVIMAAHRLIGPLAVEPTPFSSIALPLLALVIALGASLVLSLALKQLSLGRRLLA